MIVVSLAGIYNNEIAQSIMNVLDLELTYSQRLDVSRVMSYVMEFKKTYDHYFSSLLRKRGGEFDKSVAKGYSFSDSQDETDFDDEIASDNSWTWSIDGTQLNLTVAGYDNADKVILANVIVLT